MLPGDRVLTTLPPSGKLRLGPGLQVTGETPSAVIATQLGVLNQTKSGKLWIKSQQKRYLTHVSHSLADVTCVCLRYVPAIDEAVVGIVQDRNAEVKQLPSPATTADVLCSCTGVSGGHQWKLLC